MALFGKKKPEEPEIDPAELARARAWAKLTEHIEKNPLFHQMSFDGMQWVDPFTCELVPAPFGHTEVARQYYQEHDHWRKGSTRSLAEIQVARWQHYLRENYASDDRLKVFGPGGEWREPFSGTLVNNIPMELGKPDARSFRAMAITLVNAGAKSPSTLKDAAALRAMGGDESEASGGYLIDDGSGGFAIGDEVPHQHASGSSSDSGQLTSMSSGGALSINRRMAGDDMPGSSGSDRRPASSQIGASALRSLIEEKNEHDAQDLEKARRVQEHLLGDVPELEGFEIAVHYKPHGHIGGDVYDFIRLDNDRLFMFLGDVSGHGVQAALVTTTIIKSLRFITKDCDQLVEILAQLNDNAREDLVTGQFITGFAAILDLRQKQIEVCCAGHHPGLCIHPGGPDLVTLVGTKGMGIGLAKSDLIRKALKSEVYQLQAGDILVQYTDGVSEAMNSAKVEFDDARVIGASLVHAEESLSEMVEHICDEAMAWSQGVQEDDLTVIGIAVLE